MRIYEKDMPATELALLPPFVPPLASEGGRDWPMSEEAVVEILRAEEAKAKLEDLPKTT